MYSSHDSTLHVWLALNAICVCYHMETLQDIHWTFLHIVFEIKQRVWLSGSHLGGVKTISCHRKSQERTWGSISTRDSAGYRDRSSFPASAKTPPANSVMVNITHAFLCHTSLLIFPRSDASVCEHFSANCRRSHTAPYICNLLSFCGTSQAPITLKTESCNAFKD